MQALFAYNALIWKNTITFLTLILFVVFLVRGLYLFAVLGKHLLKSNQGFQYQQQARDTRSSFFPQTYCSNGVKATGFEPSFSSNLTRPSGPLLLALALISSQLFRSELKTRSLNSSRSFWRYDSTIF